MLASAFCHASWNAWAKSRPDPSGALMAIVIGSAWPSLGLLAFAGIPARASWLWIALTVAISIPAQLLLGSAYREGDFAVAYPILRGLNPLAVALAAVPIFGEPLGAANGLGVLCVSVGIALIGWEAARRSRTMTLRGLGFAGLAAALTAIAALCDYKGARAAGDPFAYAPAVATGNAIAMTLFQACQRSLPRLLARHWRIGLAGPLVSTASYLLSIWSLMRAPVAQVASLRETSMLFAVAIGALVLRERVGPWRWTAVAVVFAGVLLLRL